MSRFLCLDPSQNCGWAHGVPGGDPIFGVHTLQGERYSAKSLNLEGFLISMIKGNRISRVFAEKPILPMVTSFDSMMSMAGIAAVIGMTCARIGVDLIFVDQQTWRVEFMGLKQAPKMSDEQIADRLQEGARKTRFLESIERKRDLTDKELDWVRAVSSGVRRDWLKNYTIEACRKRGVEPDDDNAADALGIFYSRSDRETKRAATPQFDLLGGLTI